MVPVVCVCVCVEGQSVFCTVVTSVTCMCRVLNMMSSNSVFDIPVGFLCCITSGYLQCVPKKEATTLAVVTLLNLNRFSKLCHWLIQL